MPTPALTESCYYILLSLLEPLHGYGIMQKTEGFSHGRVKLAAGTLYGALTGLCDKGYIKLLGEDDSGRKNYVITDDGRAVLMGELKRLHELVANGEAQLMTGGEND